MAQIIENYVDSYGAVHGTTYWRFSVLYANSETKIGEFIFKGYVSQEAFHEGKACLATFTCVLKDSAFINACLTMVEGGKTLYETLAGVAYEIAKAEYEWFNAGYSDELPPPQE